MALSDFRFYGWCALLGAFAMAAALANGATIDRDPWAECQRDTMIVLDASGSMSAIDFPDGAPSRMDRAKRSLRTVLEALPPTRRVGLVTYGPGSNLNACQNTELRVPLQQNFAGPIMAEVDLLRPDGRTPLANGVELAARALGTAGGSVVLLTDGQETCWGNPCGLAEQLAAQRHITVHVIGYKLRDRDGTDAASGAECLAERTHGQALTADTAEELVAALQKSLACPDVAASSHRARHGASVL